MSRARTRAEMAPAVRAVSDALDEYLARHHGIVTSHTNPEDFTAWLSEHGYEVRPSVTDNARAEAERRYRRQAMHVGTAQDREVLAFMAGAEWAAGRAETTTPMSVTDDARADLAEALTKYEAEIKRAQDSGQGAAIAILAGASLAHAVRDSLAAGRAETTTATTEAEAEVDHECDHTPPCR